MSLFKTIYKGLSYFFILEKRNRNFNKHFLKRIFENLILVVVQSLHILELLMILPSKQFAY